MAPCATVSVRGTALASVLRQAQAEAPKTLESILAKHASPGLRETLDGIDASAWYPADRHLEFLDLVMRHVYASDDKRFEAMATAAIHEDLRGMHKILLKVRSPSWALQSAGRSFRAYFSYGTLEVVEPTPVSGTLAIKMEPCSHALWLAIAGGTRAILEASGADEVVIERDVDVAENRCSLSLRWS